jgi:hypothetical protein
MTDKQVAWNGIRFEAPESWEPGRIGRQYLMLENRSGPVVEIKWQRIKGKFSHRAQLKRLAGQGGNKKIKTFKVCPLPGEWGKALDRYDATGFTWQGRRVQGKGAILYCHACRNATLLQFTMAEDIGGAPEGLPKTFTALLSSFRDHPEQGKTIYAMYDIRAEIPQDFALAYFRFTPGEFELRFKSGARRLTLYRWGLASALLAGKDLGAFVKNRVHLPEVASVASGNPGVQAREWQWMDHAAGAGWWRRRFAAPGLRKFRAWHLAAADRIFGVSMEAKAAADFDLFDQVCADYETV